MDQRDVRIDRLGPAHRLVDGQLAESVVEVIVAADHMGHTHVMIVDDHRQHIGRRAIRTQQDQIVQLGILHGHAALHPVLDRDRTLARCAQAHDEGLTLRRGRGIGVAPGRPDTQGLLGGLGGFALGSDLVLRHVAAIGVAARHHLLRDRGMAVGPRELEHGVTVPVQAQPAHPVQDRVDRGLGRAGAVGILDAQQELAAIRAREQPVEQRRACAADVKESGRRGRETGHDSAHGRSGGDIICCAQPRILPA